jgi:mannose-6-phosphate isomerase-like protein (cupin superfamily)
MHDKAIVITPATRPAALDVFGTHVTVLAAASESGCYGLTCQSGPEGAGPPPHHHPWDESFFVLSGEVRFRCGDEEHVCPPGSLVHVPRNTVHAFSYGAGGGSMLEITSENSRAAEMFRAVDAAIDAANPDIPRALAVLNEHGVSVVGG